jgi:membrane protease YdiL (CAAX protease family)
MQTADLPITPTRASMLVLFCAATILLIPLHWHLAGAVAWLDSEAALKRRMLVVLGTVALLSATDINTSTSDRNFLQVGIPFALVILVPSLILGKTDPGVVRFRFIPTRWRRADIIYTILSIPLAWVVLEFYWWVNPDLHLNWSLPPDPDQGEIRRLFIGINCVGIWDELFFVNTVFAIVRSLFPYLAANLVQAVVYTSVLNDMAFTGIGPLIVFGFAWTQGSMFEKSEGLIWVLIVHLIVDFFLVAAIVGSYYPGFGLDYLWRHGM